LLKDDILILLPEPGTTTGNDFWVRRPDFRVYFRSAEPA